MLEGIALKAMSNYVQVAVGQNVYLCSLRGRLRKKKDTVMTGDHVKITLTGDDSGVVEEILPRRNRLIRPAIANVDQALVIQAVTRPAVNSNMLDRMLVILSEKDLDAVICFNKYDLMEEMDSKDQQELSDLTACYRKIGYPVLTVSIVDEESINDIEAVCQNKISVLAGPSGVGKSSILNVIRPALSLATGSVSSKSGQGRHTTRHVELLRIGENGYLADSPGFSVLDFPDMKLRDLGFYFPEMVPHIPHCRFNSCLHHKEPDCAVKQAVEDGHIDPRRYSNYVVFLDEIKNKERRY